jgi:hypothetical protein
LNRKISKHFKYEIIRTFIVICFVTFLTWSITTANTVIEQSPELTQQAEESTPTPTEDTSTSESSQEDDAIEDEESSEPDLETEPAPTKPTIEDVQSPVEIETPVIEPTPSESDTSSTSDSEPQSPADTGTTSSETDTSTNASSTDSTSGGFLSGLVDTVKNAANSVKDFVTDTVDKVANLLTATSTPETLEQLEIIPEEISEFDTTIIFTEEDTSLGKLVTVSAPNEDPNNPIVDVLASTTIPEIYQVGEEDKIKIKWKNNGDQQMSFNAYDTDENGYLDYVEWTIPHLSTQIFEIIFISKAFQLDSSLNIIADIYDTVSELDGDYATVSDGEYVRVTFEQILDYTKDNTVYARALDINNPASIEIYPVYLDSEGNYIQGSQVAIIENITDLGVYKTFLTNLNTPTDIFDLRIIGNVEIDFVVDPIVLPLFTAEANGPIDSCETYTTDPCTDEIGVTIPGSTDDVDVAGFTLIVSAPTTVNTIVDTIGGGSLTIDNDLTATTITNVYLYVTGGDITITADINHGLSGEAVMIAQGASLSDYVGTLTLTDGFGIVASGGNIADVSGTVNNQGSGYGVANNFNDIIVNISGTINNSGDGYGVYNYGTLTTFSGTITNSGGGYGIVNAAGGTITNISETAYFTNNGYAAIWNESGGQIDYIYGTIENSGDVGVHNEGTILDIAGTITNNGNVGYKNYGSAYILDISGTITNNTSGFGISLEGGTINYISGTIENTSTGVGIKIYDGGLDVPNGATFTNTGGGYGIQFDSFGSGYIGALDNPTVDLDLAGQTVVQPAFAWSINSLADSVGGGSLDVGFGLTVTETIVDVPLIVSGTGVTIVADIDSALSSYSTYNYAIKVNPGASLTDYVGTMNKTGYYGIYNEGIIDNISGDINNSSENAGNSGSVGIYNVGSIGIIGGALIHNAFDGYGIENYGSIGTISGAISNWGYTAINNDGTITSISADIINSGSGYGIFSGSINGAAQIDSISGVITNDGSGTGIYVSQGTVSEISASIDNYGYYAIYNGATIDSISGIITNTGYAGIDNGGTITDISGYVGNNTDGDARAIYNTGTIIDISGIVQNNTSGGYGIENYGTIEDISGYALSSYSEVIYNSGSLNNFSGITINSFTPSVGLENTSISGNIINLPSLNFSGLGIWLNTNSDYDWDNANNWLLGFVPNKTSNEIILLADMVLPSNISNPIYFAADNITLDGNGYTVDDSIYGIDGNAELGINNATKGRDINLVDVEWTGTVMGGIGGNGDINTSADGGSVSINVTDLDLSSKIINGGVSGMGGSGDGTNGNLTLTYQSLTTNTSTYLYDIGTLTINGSDYVDLSGNSLTCLNGVMVGPGCAWNGVFDPIIFYFNNAVDTNWNTLGNWWNDAQFTVPATYLPTALNQVFIHGEITDLGIGDTAEVDTITFNGTSTSAIDITVVQNAIFNGSSSNTGNITLSGIATFNETSSNTGTITAATSTFYEDTTSTVGGTILGFIQRIFTSSATTLRDFTTEGGRNDWTIISTGVNTIVNLANATYDLATNIFKGLLGGSFVSNSSISEGTPVVPTVTIASPIPKTTGDTTKWAPSIDWGTAITCTYSYDNWTTSNTLNCANNGSDLPRPTAMVDRTLYLRAIDSHGGLTEKSLTYRYNNTVATYTMCGADLLDENRPYYYLNQDVTGPCTITASAATTTLRGNLVSTSTGYTVTGNIVGNGKHINLQNISVTGTVDSNGGNIILSNGTFDGAIDSDEGAITTTGSTLSDTINSYGGTISFGTTIALATTTSQGGNITITNSTTTNIVSTATTSDATAGTVTINTSVIGNIIANGVAGTNGGNGGVITIATSTTGVLYANGANGITNGGNGGNINVTNSFATPVGSGIFSNGGNSTSCGNGGDAGFVTLTNSTYGTITANGGSGADNGCPGSGGTSGQSRTIGNGITVEGTYTPPSSGGGDTSTPSTPPNNTGGGSSNSTTGLINNLANPNIDPIDFTPIQQFTPFGESFVPTNLGATVIPDPFQGFNPPGQISFVQLPANFLPNISSFLFAPIPSTIMDALANAPRLQSYMGSVGLSTEQDLASLTANPEQLEAPDEDNLPPGLFLIKSGNNILTSYATYDQAGGGLAQLVKVSPSQSLSISLVPLSTGEVNAEYLGQTITFQSSNNLSIAYITSSNNAGRYVLTTQSSPIPLLIEVEVPTEQVPTKKPWGIFYFIWKLLFE